MMENAVPGVFSRQIGLGSPLRREEEREESVDGWGGVVQIEGTAGMKA